MSLSDREIKFLLEKIESCMALWRQSLGSGGLLKYLEEARGYYDELIENAPAHAHFFSERANILFVLDSWGKGDLFHAIEDINKAIELDPDQAAHYDLRGAFLFHEQSDNNDKVEKKQLLAKIIADCKISLQKDPSNHQTWFLLMAVCILSYNWDDAISLYGSCKPYLKDKGDFLTRSWLGCLALTLAVDPPRGEDKTPLVDQTIRIQHADEIMICVASFVGENYLYGYLCGQEEDREHWQKAREIQKLFTEHLDREFDRANMLQKVGYYNEALKAIDKELELHPDFTQAQKLKDKINYFIEKNKTESERAEEIKRKLGAIGTEITPKAWFEKGSLLFQLKHYEDSLNAFNKVIELDPKYPDVWDYKSQCLVQLGRYKEALEAVGPEPTAQAWYGIGRNLEGPSSYEEAGEAFNRAIALEAGHLGAWDYKGRCFLKLKHYEDALKAIDKLMEINFTASREWHRWHDRTKCLYELHRYQEALVSVDASIELANEQASDRLDWLRDYRTKILSNLELGEPGFKSPAALGYKLYVLQKLGHYEEALEVIDKIIAASPSIGAAENWYRKANILENLRRYQEALDACNKALEFNPGDILVQTKRDRLFLKCVDMRKERIIAFKVALEKIEKLADSLKDALYISYKDRVIKFEGVRKVQDEKGVVGICFFQGAIRYTFVPFSALTESNENEIVVASKEAIKKRYFDDEKEFFVDNISDLIKQIDDKYGKSY